MAFRDLISQDIPIAALRHAVASGRLPGALMFNGPAHVGKRTAALNLAKLLNCRQPVVLPNGDTDCCDQCASCRKVDEGVHPDVIVVEPEGQFIKIDQIRRIGDQLGLNPFEAKKRVVVVHQAQRMNPEAANAFLKTLEEPPADSLLVLCADGLQHLPDTIVSRCMHLRFGVLAPGDLSRLFQREGTLAPDTAAFWAQFAQGQLHPKLVELAPARLEIRETLLRWLERPRSTSYAEVVAGLYAWAGKTEWRFVLDWLETLARDMGLMNEGLMGEEAGVMLINADRKGALMNLLPWCQGEVPKWLHREVLATRKAIELNAAKPLALETLWLKIRQMAKVVSAA